MFFWYCCLILGYKELDHLEVLSEWAFAGVLTAIAHLEQSAPTQACLISVSVVWITSLADERSGQISLCEVSLDTSIDDSRNIWKFMLSVCNVVVDNLIKHLRRGRMHLASPNICWIWSTVNCLVYESYLWGFQDGSSLMWQHLCLSCAKTPLQSAVTCCGELQIRAKNSGSSHRCRWPNIFPKKLVSRGGLDVCSSCLAPFEISVLGESRTAALAVSEPQEDKHRTAPPPPLSPLKDNWFRLVLRVHCSLLAPFEIGYKTVDHCVCEPPTTTAARKAWRMLTDVDV